MLPTNLKGCFKGSQDLPLVVLNASQEQIDLWGTNVEDWLSTRATRHQLSKRADYMVLKKSSAEPDMFTS